MPRSLEGPLTALDAPHEGWTPVPPPTTVGLGNSFVAGDPQGMRLRVAYFLRAADAPGGAARLGRVWFGPLAEGPPKHVHGGAMSAVLDATMGAAAWAAGHRVVAARLTVEFKRPCPLGTTVTFACRVTAAEGRRVTTAGELVLPDGTVCATGEGVFVTLDMDKLRAAVS